MTVNLDFPGLTDDEIRQQITHQPDACQHGTDPLTAVEVDAITRYARDTIGVIDAVETLDADGIRSHGAEFGQADALNMVRSHFRMLDQWKDRIVSLREDLPLTASGDFSPAVTRFLGAEVVGAESAARSLHDEVVAYFLGKDEYGYSYGGLRPCDGSRFVDGMVWVQPSI